MKRCLLLGVPFLVIYLLLPSGSIAYQYRPKDLRCYTCNVDGYPSCDIPFSLDNNKLAFCDENRPDNATELCAKIYGIVVEGEYGKFRTNSSYFGRGCFPLGEGWIWRTEPYNETFIFGNLTIEGSIYMCRSSKCNGSLRTAHCPSMGPLATVAILVATLVLWTSRGLSAHDMSCS